MADKYLWHGNTYCGDGTTSAAAASAGAVGAWNNINVLTGTAPAYGSLVAGDTVYIRSKDASATDLTITFSANLSIGSSSASAGNEITWILDNGVVWSGIDGTLTISTSGNYIATLLDYNCIVSSTKYAWSLVNLETSTGTSYGVVFSDGSSAYQIKIDFSANTGNGKRAFIENALLESCYFKVGSCYIAHIYIAINSHAIINNLELELTVDEPEDIFFFNSSCSVLLQGGRIFGAGALNGRVVCDGKTGADFRAIGFKVPKTLTMFALPNNQSSLLSAMGMDDLAGAAVCCMYGQYDSRNDGYYPTLNATLPFATPIAWSWYVYPSVDAGLGTPLVLPIVKLFTQSAATKTVTLQFLLSNDFSGVNTGNCWLMVSYVDDTSGEVRCLDSKDHSGGALTTSTAGWSATTYGANSFSKYKIALTTPTTIKQDTQITASLLIGVPSSTVNDILFVCPDVQLT